jgi:GntR family transcriptional regulator
MSGTNKFVVEAMYRQIAEDLRGQIESGQLLPGQQLPTELELRQRYSASRNTIRDALKLLTTRGLIVARAGQGTFVSAPIVPFITTLSKREAEPQRETPYYGIEVADTANMGRSFSASVSRVELQRAADHIAAMLWLPEDTEVVSRQQVRYIDLVPWSLQTSFYPMKLVTRGAGLLLRAAEIPAGTLAYLKETLGLDEVGYQDLIRVGPPDREEASIFRLPDDGSISVITVLRTGYATDDQGLVPFRVTITVFPADRNQFRVISGEVPEPE